ncbi:ExbD/TolR family protein [Haliangium sp.]|uniref:ExbD/TolR family protein n=1 Tax=Haliangium sp. TaxID=2663208 RepID=UPI003D0B6ED5
MAGSSLYQDEEGQGAISDINVTPLVDVVLVLLIIFMVTAKLIVARGIQVDSPKTASGEEVKSTLQVTIDRDRILYVNGDRYDSVESAQARVEEMHAQDAELKAIISADRAVPHGDVMRVIDFVKLAGVTKFALTSDPLDSGGQGAAGP